MKFLAGIILIGLIIDVAVFDHSLFIRLVLVAYAAVFFTTLISSNSGKIAGA